MGSRGIDGMGRRQLLAACLFAAGLACLVTEPALGNVLIQVDKPMQTMTVAVDGQVRYAGVSRLALPGSPRRQGRTRPSAWKSCITRESGTTPACRMRSFSRRGGIAFTARTTPASARRSRTDAYGSRCRTRRRSINSSKRRACHKRKSSSEDLIHPATPFQVSRRNRVSGPGEDFASFPSRDAGPRLS